MLAAVFMQLVVYTANLLQLHVISLFAVVLLCIRSEPVTFLFLTVSYLFRRVAESTYRCSKVCGAVTQGGANIEDFPSFQKILECKCCVRPENKIIVGNATSA